MTTRITDSIVSRTILGDLGAADTRLALTQRRLASGKQLTRPSDDPFGTNRAIQLRSELEATRQYRRNVNDGSGWSQPRLRSATATNLGGVYGDGDGGQVTQNHLTSVTFDWTNHSNFQSSIPFASKTNSSN